MNRIRIQKARRSLGRTLSKKGIGRPRSILTLDNVLKITGGEFHGNKADMPRFFSNVAYSPEVQEDGLALAAHSLPLDVDREITKEEANHWGRQGIKNGAACILTNYEFQDMPCIVVDNPIRAIIALIKARMAKLPRLNVIAVTGTIGKTSTAQMAAQMFDDQAPTQYDLPTWKGLRYSSQIAQSIVPGYRYWIQEFDEVPYLGYPGIMSQMLSPAVGIVTKISDSNVDRVGDIKDIVKSCMSMADGLKSDGLMIMNGDDQYQRGIDIERPTLFYGIEADNLDYRAVNIEESIDGLSFDIVYDAVTVPISLKAIGRYNVYNALACFAAGKAMGLSDKAAAEGIGNYAPTGVRQNLVSLRGRRLFMDCYNASKTSIKGVLKTIEPIKPRGKKIALLGSSGEMDEFDEKEHREIGQLVAQSNLDEVIFYGSKMKFAKEEYDKATGKIASYFEDDDRQDVVKALNKDVQAGDFLLVKGTRSSALEKIVDAAYGSYFSELYSRTSIRLKPLSESGFRYREFDDYVVIVGGRRRKKLEIPESLAGLEVGAVGESAFIARRAPEHLIVGGNCRSLRKSCFEWGTRMKVAEIGPSVAAIEERAFNGCSSLHRLVLHDGLDRIGKQAFYGCKSLKELRIPNSVTFIDDYAFEGCGPLDVYVEAESDGEYAIDNYVLRHPKTKVSVISI